MIPNGYQLKIGDVVRVVPPPLDEKRRTPDGLLVPKEMEEYYGGVYTVSSVNEIRRDRVALDRVVRGMRGIQSPYAVEWWWDRWCLEIVTKNEIDFDGLEELL